MLVQGDQLADGERGQGHAEDGGGRTVAGEHASRDDLLRGAFGAHFVGGLTERQSLGLGEVVAQEQFVHVLVAVLGRVRGVDERDEVGRDELGALVNQLVEGVLAVGARLTPEDLAGLGGDGGAVPTHGLAVGFHGQLLQVGREAVQVLVVRQHGVGGDLEEVAVPHVEHAEQHDHVLLERGVGEVFIDLVEAVQELLEAGRAEDDGQRGADGGVDGVTAADPVPEAERVVRVDAEFGDLLQVGGDGDEVLLDGFGVLLVGAVDGALGLELFEQPGAGFTGVGQGFQGGEGLGDDDEQGGLRIEALGLLGQIVGVDVGDVAGGDAGVGVRLEGLVHHDGTQVGAADADVDHGFDLLAGHTGPLAGTDLVGEGVDAVEHLAHVLDGVLAVDDVLAFILDRATQRGVQHGAVFGVVDVHTGVHSLGALIELDGLGKVGEQLEGFRLDQVLGQIEVQVAGVEGQLLDALGVFGEPLLEAHAFGLKLVIVLLQGSPLRGLGGVNGRIDGHRIPFLSSVTGAPSLTARMRSVSPNRILTNSDMNRTKISQRCRIAIVCIIEQFMARRNRHLQPSGRDTTAKPPIGLFAEMSYT